MPEYTHPKGAGAGKYNGMLRAKDWEGKKIRATRQIRNGGGNGVMPGATGVVESAHRRLRVTFNKCEHCGSVLHVSDLDYASVELIEQPKREELTVDPQSWMITRIERGDYDANPGEKNPIEVRQKKKRERRANFQKDLELAFFDVDEVKTPNKKDREKLDLLFRLAWEHGHSAGYSEVLIYYEEMVPLLK